MSTLTQLRDAIQGFIRTKWLADPATLALPLLWDDVEGDKPGHSATGTPIAFGRSTIRHTAASTETIGRGPGAGKEEHRGQVVVQVFTPRGTGYGTADTIAQVVKRFFQRQRIPGVDGWFSEVEAIEVPALGPWAQVNVVAPFRYTEQVT